MTAAPGHKPQLSRAAVESDGKMIDNSAIGLLRLIHEDIQALNSRQQRQDDRQDAADARMETHMASEEATFARIMGAFPDGPERHCEAHQAMIAAARAQEQFWRDLRVDVAKKGILGLLVVICGLILTGAAAKFGLAIK